MGTVATGVNPPGEYENYMIKALEEKFEIAKKYNEKSHYADIKRFEKRTGYRNLYMLELDNQKLAVLSGPPNYYAKMPRYRVVFHLSKFSSMEQACDMLIYAFGYKLAYYIFHYAKVQRVDVWIDLKVSLDRAKRAIYKDKIGYARKYFADVGDLQSYYYGSKYSDSYYILYEKIRDEENMEFLTRIEKCLSGKKCPINHLSEYRKLADLNLFDDIAYYNHKINLGTYFKFKDSNQKLARFIKRLTMDGLQSAKRRYCKDKNFSHVLWPFFISRSRGKKDLSQIFKKHVMAFTFTMEEVWA